MTTTTHSHKHWTDEGGHVIHRTHEILIKMSEQKGPINVL